MSAEQPNDPLPQLPDDNATEAEASSPVPESIESAANELPPIGHKWPTPLTEDFNDPDWPNLEDSDENILDWVMKTKKLLVRTVTWNLCAKPPPPKEQLQNSLFTKRFHLYVIGSEECERSIAQSAINPSKKNWEAYLCAALGPSYVPLRSHTLQAIHIMAFVHRSLSHLCSVVTSAALPTGMGNTLGNKGAVALFLKIGNTKMLIVNAHLSAHQKAEKQRNAEFQKINVQIPTLLEKKDSSIGAAEVITTDFNSTSPDNAVPPNTESGAALSPTTATEGTDTNNNNDSDDEAEPNNDDTIVVTRTQSSSVDVRTKSTSKQLHQCADVVVFMGDLNYRINGNRSIVSKLLNSNMHEVLLSNDQLKMNIQKGLVFEKFVEAPLNFKPTYKFDLGSNTYDSGPKKRIPSWTDRILYVESPNVTCLAYNSDESIMTSDHRPVYASFMVHFSAFVQLDDNQNAIVPASKVKFTSESQVCTIS